MVNHFGHQKNCIGQGEDKVTESMRKTDWNRVDSLLESAIENIQSVWMKLNTYSYEERYEKRWPLNSPQYNLQGAEEQLTALYQELAQHLPDDHDESGMANDG